MRLALVSVPRAPRGHGRRRHHWLLQFVLAAALVGHSSLRGTQEMLDCLLDLPVSLGWVHSVVKDAIAKAVCLNDSAELSGVEFAALSLRSPELAVKPSGVTTKSATRLWVPLHRGSSVRTWEAGCLPTRAAETRSPTANWPTFDHAPRARDIAPC
jgi:hypothetical protein